MRLLITLLSLLIIACGTRVPTQTTPLAPKKPLPPLVESPDLSHLSATANKVRDKNTELKSEVSWYRNKNFDLTNALRALEGRGAATLEELGAVRMRSEEMQANLGRVELIVTEQKSEIDLLQVEVNTKQRQVAAMTQERDTLRNSLMAANTDLESLTAENKTVKGEGDAARAALAAMKESRDAERKWKWIFVAATSVLGAALVGSWGIYLYVKFGRPI